MSPRVCRVPTDNIVLGWSLTAEADYLVTGDRDLLDLHPFHNLSIVSPRDFELLFANQASKPVLGRLIVLISNLPPLGEALSV